MDQKQFTEGKIREQALLPLFYHEDPATCVAAMKALYEAGVRCIEFTNRGEKAIENFSTLIGTRDAEMKDMLVGIGTIRNADQAREFIGAGADFMVSPIIDLSIEEVASAGKILWIPGCMTPTEINLALEAGINLLKLFPGNVLGPSFVESARAVFSRAEFIITGGVDTTEQNIRAWFRSGAVAVGMGSKLMTKEILDNGKYDQLKSNTKKLMALIQKIRGELVKSSGQVKK